MQGGELGPDAQHEGATMAESGPGGVTIPIVVDLGKQGRKRIKQLKAGEGTLSAQVQDVVEQARAKLGAEADGKELIPVVVLYRRKDRRRKRGFLSLL